MATATVKARKAARRSGAPFVPKPAKTPTPLEERAFIVNPVRRTAGDAMPIGAPPMSTYRSPRRAAEFLMNGGRPNAGTQKRAAE